MSKGNMDLFASWVGIGAKGGGTVAFIGMETLDGVVTNLGLRTDSHPLNVTGARLGLGLGGGAGLVALIVYNCYNLMNLNNTPATDWSINLALGGKWDGVVKGLKGYKFFETIARMGNKIAKAPPSDIDNIRNSMSYLYTAYDIGSMGGAPKLVSIDIPFLGIGLEVSAHYIDGMILIGELMEEDTVRFHHLSPPM